MFHVSHSDLHLVTRVPLGTGKTIGLLGSEKVSSIMDDLKGGDAYTALRVSFPLSGRLPLTLGCDPYQKSHLHSYQRIQGGFSLLQNVTMSQHVWWKEPRV